MDWLKEYLPTRAKLEQAALCPLLLCIQILGEPAELSESVAVVGFYILALLSLWTLWRSVRQAPPEFVEPVE